MPRWVAVVTLAVAGALLAPPAHAEQGVLVVQVSDVMNRPIAGVRIATRGDGSIGAPTDAAGRTRIRLAAQTRPATIVALTIAGGPKPRDLVFISPWDNHVRIPPFENESQNFVTIVLADRGERTALESGRGVAAMVARVNLATSSRDAAAPARPADALNDVAALFGLTPAAVVDAIRRSGTSADPYDKGMAALFDGNLDAASDGLAAALKVREAKFESGTRGAADAAFFLAQTLYREGNFSEAADAYRKALKYRPGDPTTTNNLGLTLMQAGDYRGAEPVLAQAIATIEMASGPNDPDLVFALNNLGALLVARGDLARAEALFRRGLTIRQKALGPDDPRTANSLNNVASALLQNGDAAAAEPLLASAATIFARAASVGVPVSAPGPSANQAVLGGGVLGNAGRVSVRLNQALLLAQRKRFEEARTIAEDVLRTQIQTSGLRRPETANALLVMGQTELAAGNAEAAARQYEQAIDVIRGLLGPEHLSLAEAYTGLGDAAARLRDTARARQAYSRAVAIRRQAFGDGDTVALAIARKLDGLGR